MKVAGFTIIRSAITYDYPVVEAITSILPICDVFYVGVGNSTDETRKLIESIQSEKIIIIDTLWDDTLREGGRVLAIETNKVFDAIPKEYNWCFYIQSDECVHEQDLPTIKQAMLQHVNNQAVDGLLFKYKHFYGHYNYIGVGGQWYKNEIRIIKNNKKIRSYKDAQGFRTTDNNKLKVKKIEAYIYHYGWVKPPKAQQAKQQNFHKMWHNDEWLKKNVANVQEFDYNSIDVLEKFKGAHPAVFAKRIAQATWQYTYNKKNAKLKGKYKFIYFIEKYTGWRIGENKNYKVV